MGEAEEGCLSLPGLYAPVARPEKIVVNAYDLDGKELNLELEGLLARVVQHERDHLDGVLFALAHKGPAREILRPGFHTLIHGRVD